MKESVFQGEFKHCLSMSGFWVTKFYDTPGQRFTLQKPFDFLAIKNGIPYAFELKMVKGFKPIRARDFMRGKELKDEEIKANWTLCNQCRSLDSVLLAGGRAYLVINVRKREEKLNEVIFLSWPYARKLITNNELTKELLQNLSKSDFGCTMKSKMFSIKV